MNTPIQGRRAKVELYEDATDMISKNEILAVISAITDHYMDPPIDRVDEIKYQALMEFKNKLFPIREPMTPEEEEALLKQEIEF